MPRSDRNFSIAAMMLGTSLPGPAGGAYTFAWLATDKALT